MKLSRLRMIDGVTVEIYAGDIPADVLRSESIDPNTAIHDPVLIIVKHNGEFVISLTMRRSDFDMDDDNALIQDAIDKIAGLEPHPPGPRLVD